MKQNTTNDQQNTTKMLQNTTKMWQKNKNATKYNQHAIKYNQNATTYKVLQKWPLRYAKTAESGMPKPATGHKQPFYYAGTMRILRGYYAEIYGSLGLIYDHRSKKMQIRRGI